MTSYFSGFVDFVGAHPHYALTAVFLLAFGSHTCDPHRGSRLAAHCWYQCSGDSGCRDPLAPACSRNRGSHCGRWFVVLAEQPDITLAELETRLAKKKVLVGKSSISRFLHHLKLPFKKKSAGRRAGSARRRRRA